MLLQLDNRRLHYDLIGPPAGQGDVVCFAHALAADSGMWAEQVAPLLGLGLRVLRIDMRGHGGSDAVAGDYTLDTLADDIVAVLNACGIARIHFVGLSVGGMIGQALALRHGARVASMMLCEAPAAALINAVALWSPRVAAVRAAQSLEPIADATMTRWLTEAFQVSNPARWSEIRRTVAATSPAGYCGCVAALSHFDFTAALPRLRVRALAVYGEDDVASSADEAEKLARLIPGAQFVLFPDARHLPNVESPERFNKILTDWLKG
jgi:3-oxoadipate enol-lactonase